MPDLNKTAQDRIEQLETLSATLLYFVELTRDGGNFNRAERDEVIAKAEKILNIE